MAKLKAGTTIGGSTAWHSGNDGSGSGLDADLLDGYHASVADIANTVVVRDGSGNINATASQARYADLAEKYLSDSNYEAGTVVVFGGDAEVTTTTEAGDTRVAGVVSTDPAYLMNSELTGEFVIKLALRGRVPCKVTGVIKKGDLLVTSSVPGVAIAATNPTNVPAASIIGKAIAKYDSKEIGVIEILI